MNRFHIYQTSRGWAVRRREARRVIKYYQYRSEAIARARELLLRDNGGDIFIHRLGRIEHKVTVEYD